VLRILNCLCSQLRHWGYGIHMKRAIRDIRKGMESLGYPVDHLSDEEIIKACGHTVAFMRHYRDELGLTTQQLAQRFDALGKAARENNL